MLGWNPNLTGPENKTKEEVRREDKIYGRLLIVFTIIVIIAMLYEILFM